jgi:hypothetical protein
VGSQPNRTSIHPSKGSRLSVLSLLQESTLGVIIKIKIFNKKGKEKNENQLDIKKNYFIAIAPFRVRLDYILSTI